MKTYYSKIVMVLMVLPFVADAFKHIFNNQTFEQEWIEEYSKGYIEEYLVSKDDEFRHSSILIRGLPLISNTKLGIAYLFAIFYCFIGLVVG